jgi:hypothetical protein
MDTGKSPEHPTKSTADKSAGNFLISILLAML